jgi:hypothetical protein
VFSSELFVVLFNTRVPTGSRYEARSIIFRVVQNSKRLPMGTGAANYESGDFGTSPFFEQLNGKPRPASTYTSVVPISTHKGTGRL